MSLPLGSTVRTSTGHIGTLRYVGDITAAPGVWCGIELSDATGKNDGSVKGQRYFQCPPLHGVFAKKEAVKIVQTAPSPTKSLNTKRQSTIETNSPRRSVQNADGNGSKDKDAQIEDLKAKLRAMERKRLEDREDKKQVLLLQAKLERLEKNAHVDSQHKPRIVYLQELLQKEEKRSATLESQKELATLDKEAMEDIAGNLEKELHDLRSRYEVLSLEYDILKEENSELSTNMSEEEKANSGWIHLERERDRLLEALLLLKDHKQEVESSLRQEIENLQTNLDETEEAAGKYLETADTLHRVEETNLHLKEQLEAAENQEEVIDNMMQERDRHLEQIDGLKSYLADQEELIQTNEDIEKFYADTERVLLQRLDEQEAILHERETRNIEQERTIEDLEFTLNKFRTIVQSLQSEIDEARQGKEISESQALNMTTKARAMMDLNMKLQNNAAKSQSKAIDVELVKTRALLTSRHVEILTAFLPDNFDSERTPIAAFLAFSRLRANATLVGQTLLEKAADSPGMRDDQDALDCYQVVTHMQTMHLLADGIVTYMASCSAEQFQEFSNAAQELQPVERNVSNWLEAVKNDYLTIEDSSNTERIKGILEDMYEKFIPAAAPGTKAHHLVSTVKNAQTHFELMALLLSWLKKLAELNLEDHREGKPDAVAFKGKVDQLVRMARANQYGCAKIVRQLESVRDKQKCLHETTWPTFEQLEMEADILRERLQQTCQLSLRFVNKIEHSAGSLYSRFLAYLMDDKNDLEFPDTSHKLTALKMTLDQLYVMASNLSSAQPFTLNPAPWTVRAKKLKAQQQISAEIQEELESIQRRNAALSARIIEKEREIEEVNIRAELAEKRVKDTKARDALNKAHRDELDKVKVAKEVIEQECQKLKLEALNLKEQAARDKHEIAALTETQKTNAENLSTANGAGGGLRVALLDSRVKSLLADVENLEGTIRHLSWENTQLSLPVTDVKFKVAEVWLGPLPKRRRGPVRSQHTRDPAIRKILSLAATLKPVRLT